LAALAFARDGAVKFNRRMRSIEKTYIEGLFEGACRVTILEYRGTHYLRVAGFGDILVERVSLNAPPIW
jgi:hypothetical protein